MELWIVHPAALVEILNKIVSATFTFKTPAIQQNPLRRDMYAVQRPKICFWLICSNWHLCALRSPLQAPSYCGIAPSKSGEQLYETSPAALCNALQDLYLSAYTALPIASCGENHPLLHCNHRENALQYSAGPHSVAVPTLERACRYSLQTGTLQRNGLHLVVVECCRAVKAHK